MSHIVAMIGRKPSISTALRCDSRSQPQAQREFRRGIPGDNDWLLRNHEYPALVALPEPYR
jgi:hypothetical protein